MRLPGSAPEQAQPQGPNPEIVQITNNYLIEVAASVAAIKGQQDDAPAA